jgi:hypothetical protein
LLLCEVIEIACEGIFEDILQQRTDSGSLAEGVAGEDALQGVARRFAAVRGWDRERT